MLISKIQEFFKFQFSDLLFLKLFALQFIVVFSRKDDPAHYFLFVLSFAIILFDKITKSPFAWGVASFALFYKLFSPYGVYFFREVDGIVLIGCLAISYFLYKKNLIELKKYFNFILALMFLNSGLGKMFFGKYLDGTALVSLINKDKRLSKPISYLSNQFSEDVKQNEKSIDEILHSYIKSDDQTRKPLVMSNGLINFFMIFSPFILFFEILVGVLGMLIFFKIDKFIIEIQNLYYLLISVFIIFTYPLISVTNIGIVVSLFAYSSADLKGHQSRNGFILLFFYVLAIRFRDYL